MSWAIAEKSYPQRRACALVGIDPRVYRYRSTRSDDGPLRTRLRELSAERRRFGYRRLHLLLRREGWEVNWKKLYRIYREENADGAPSWRPQACPGHADADGDPAGAEPALEPRLRLRRAVLWPAVPGALHHRRLQPRVPGDGRRHLALRRPRRPRARPDRRDARLSLHGGQRQRHRAHVERHPEMAGGAARRMALHRPGQAASRTGSSRASSAGSGTSS